MIFYILIYLSAQILQAFVNGEVSTLVMFQVLRYLYSELRIFLNKLIKNDSNVQTEQLKAYFETKGIISKCTWWMSYLLYVKFK